MKCSNCGNGSATTHIRQNINGKVSEAYLCPECAEKAGVGGMFGGLGSFGSFGNFGFGPFGSLIGSLFDDALPHRSIAPSKRCGTCGLTFSQIAESGEAGCPDCYDVFSSELAPSIERLHGRTSHNGKRPGSPSDEPSKDNKRSQLEVLRQQMSEAVEKQEYEQAAVLRDKIKELEGKLDKQ